jgi:nucleoside-diphosphate-sugar epimerase
VPEIDPAIGPGEHDGGGRIGEVSVALFGGGGFVGSNLTYPPLDHGGLAATVVDLDDAMLCSRFENELCCFVRGDVKRDPALADEIVAGHDAVV